MPPTIASTLVIAALAMDAQAQTYVATLNAAFFPGQPLVGISLASDGTVYAQGVNGTLVLSSDLDQQGVFANSSDVEPVPNASRHCVC